MFSKASAHKLRAAQLDRALSPETPLAQVKTPGRGWIREIREALGMSARQLGERLGVSQPTIARFEKGEMSGAITLKSLRKVAEGLNCRLVYAFVPNEPLETRLQKRAEAVAAALERQVAHSMALENQSDNEERRKRHIAEIAAELLRTLPSDFWNDENSYRSEP